MNSKLLTLNHTPIASKVSACGFPEWTNFVDGFAGALDYVNSNPNNLSAHPNP